MKGNDIIESGARVAVSIGAMCLVALMSISGPNTPLNNKVFSKSLLWLILSIVSLTIIFRPQLGDTRVYLLAFDNAIGATLGDVFATSSFDKLFALLQWSVSRITESPNVFLACVWLLFVVGFLKFLNRVFAPWQVLFVFFTYTMYMVFYSYTTVALRQGLSISMLLWGMSYSFPDGKPNTKAVLCLVSCALFHWSGLPFAVIAFVLPRWRIRLRYMLAAWGLLSVCFVFGLQSYVISPLLGFVPKLDLYTSGSTLSTYAGVNRLDFLAFGLLWIVFSLLAYRYFFTDDTYKTLIKYYVAFNCVFLLMGFVAYSDRIAGYSWFLIPLLIWFPIFKRQKYIPTLSTITLGGFMVLGFYTGVMTYYNLFVL